MFVSQSAFQPDTGDRPLVPNVAMVFTDGNSNVNQGQTAIEAARARADNIRMIVAGIGEQANLFELSTIASRPLASNLFNVSSLSIINQLTAQLIIATCDGQFKVDGLVDVFSNIIIMALLIIHN